MGTLLATSIALALSLAAATPAFIASVNADPSVDLVVHGSTFPLEWMRLTVDPHANAPQGADAFAPFRWTRVMP